MLNRCGAPTGTLSNINTCSSCQEASHACRQAAQKGPNLQPLVGQWIERYPGAWSYACPGLKEKSPEVPYTTELGSGGGDPPEWLGEVQATWLNYERNPFNGKAFFNEVHFLAKCPNSCQSEAGVFLRPPVTVGPNLGVTLSG